MTFDEKLEKVNQRLKFAKIRLTIERHGSKLCIRGLFPPKFTKSTHENIKWVQQRLPLKVNANEQGLKFAEAKAKEVSGLLDLNRFDWELFVGHGDFSLQNYIEKLEQAYFTETHKTETTLQTWRKEYLIPFSFLPSKPTVETMKQAILALTEPNTRKRRRYVIAFAKLADFMGFQHNIRELIGSYGVSSLSPRSLPNDKAIASEFLKITDPCWQWVYGMMACYGLRNHEVFSSDLLDYPIAFVNRGKTGERYVWALFPEWANDWGLETEKFPNVTGKTNSDMGSRVTKAFKRHDISFSPYNLRHAWAVRSLLFGLDISLAAAQMGHSVAIHSRIYHHWITKDIHQRAMTLILSNPLRPMPPN